MIHPENSYTQQQMDSCEDSHERYHRYEERAEHSGDKKKQPSSDNYLPALSRLVPGYF